MESPHVYIMDGDIKKAYDFTSHRAFAKAAGKKGMDEILILAWLREWRRMKSIFRLDAETKSGEVPRTRSLPQGDPAAPMLFNLVLDTLAERFVNMLEKEVGKTTTGWNMGQHHPLCGQLLVGGYRPKNAQGNDGGVAGHAG